MNEKIICEKCGTEMLSIDQYKPVGMKCPKCGWGWATTFIEPIKEDTTDYTVIMCSDNVPSKESISICSVATRQPRRFPHAKMTKSKQANKIRPFQRHRKAVQ